MASSRRKTKTKFRRDFTNSEIAAIADFLLDRGAYFMRGQQAFMRISDANRNEYERGMYDYYDHCVRAVSYMLDSIKRDPQNVQDLIAHYRRPQQSQ